MMSGKPIDRFRRATSCRLRASATGAEILLWRHLKRMETSGTHFPGKSRLAVVADFACMASRLVIELDGSQHAEEVNKSKDETRTRWLESKGYRVIRFWNNDVSQNVAGVLDAIHSALYGSRDVDPVPLKHVRRKRLHPTPARSARRPSPSRGG